MKAGLTRRQRYLGAIGMALALLLSWASWGTALAHGKELTIEVSALTPDPQQPRTRLYRTFVFFTGDREPVEGAVIALTAQRRQSGETLPPVRLEPLNIPGFYAAQVTFPRYGTWAIKLEVKEPGQEEVSFVEDVIPAALPRGAGATDEGGERSIFTVSLSFNRRDIANLAMRWVHSVSAAAWFGLSGLIVAAFWLLRAEARARFLSRLYPLFPFVAAASLALLTATGIYNAIYNSPLRPPGAFDLDLMRRIPYGTPYLVAVSTKALTVMIGAVLAIQISKGLRLMAVPPAGNPALSVSGKRPRLALLAAANLALGLAMLLSVAVMAYLHNLSHLALLVPGR